TPALELQRAIRLRDQREHRVIVRRPEDLEDASILEVPEQVSAFHDAVDPTLELRARQGLEQGSRETDVHLPEPLVRPESAWNAVQREQDLSGRPGLVLEQVLEVPGRLVEVQNRRMKSGLHRLTSRTTLRQRV